MKRVLLTLLFGLSIGLVFGQQAGDYQSRQSGIWYDVATWEVFNNGAWRQLNTVAAGPFQNVIPIHTAGVVTVKHAVLSNGNTTANQIVVDAGGVLTVKAARTLIIRGDGTNIPLQINASGSLINLGTLDLQSQIGSVPVEVLGTFSSSGTILTSNPSLLIFHPSSTYVHQNATGGNIPLATWDINSTCRISGLTGSNAGAPKNLGQAFGNFEFNALNAGYSPAFHLGGALQNVMGNLTIIATGSNVLRLASGGSGFNLNIGGNLNIQGGITILAQSVSSASTITVGGNLVISGGTLRLGTSNNTPVNLLLNGNFVKTGGTFIRGTGSGAGTVRFDGTSQTYSNNSSIPDAVHFSVQSGSTLDLGTSFLSGTGAFTLFSGATLNVGSLDVGGAIQLGGAGGNIRTTGTRTYQTGSTIVYDGAGLQRMGNGHPPLPHTTIANGAGVTMVSNVTINGNLNIGTNNLFIENNTLTLGGNLIRTSGALGASTGSSVIINGAGNFGDLVFSFTEFPNNPINNLTINRTGGTVFLGSSLIVGGTFSHTAGTLSLGQFSAYTLTLRGNFTRSGTSALSVFPNSSLVIEGTGTMPANVSIQGPDFFTLTMNRPNATFNSSSAMHLVNLNLFNGVVNNSNLNITMANNGLVTRRSGGSITSVLGVDNGGSYNVLYDVITDITTGNELPFVEPAEAATRLGNLTKTGIATVNLNHPIQVNKSLTVSQGTFNIGTSNHVAIAGNLVVNGSLLVDNSKVSFIGSAPQLIDASPMVLTDVEVNQSAASTVTLSDTTLIDIRRRLAVISGSTLNAGNDQLRLLSSADGTANVAPIASGGAIVGSVVAQRYLPKAVQRAEYYHLASPFTNATFAEWNDDTSIKSIKQYNEATAKYTNVSVASTIINGRGYVVDISNPLIDTLQASGTLRQGNVGVSVTTQTPGVVSGSYGWNLIGNPYASTIDWDNVAINETQVYNAIYMWDNFGNSGQGNGIGVSVSYVDGVGTPASFTGQLAPGQAFWVKALQNTSIQFTESAKITDTNTTVFRQKEVPNVLRIVVNGDGVNDETVVRLREGATENFDGKYDAYKYFGTGFNISTLTSDNVKAVINALGTSSCDKNIPLVTAGAKKGSFTLNFSGIDSFDPSITLALVDLVEKKTIDIRSNASYTFVVNDDNFEAIEKRFEIAIGSNAASIDNAILARGESLCEDQDLARVTLEASEPGIEYTVEWNGNKLSDPLIGTGSAIELMVRTASLAVGENEVTVMATSGICSATALATKPVITRFKRGEISSVQKGDICLTGSATLRAAGADAEGWYHWYESEDGTEPILDQKSAEFVTPQLNKTKTYYVAAVNALGCEGNRVPVQAIVSQPENVELTIDGEGNLTSSVSEGNQWYLDGLLLNGQTSNTLEPFESGIYTVEILKGNCRTSASLEVTGMGENGITLFPNPTPDKVLIRVRTTNNNVVATLVSTQGVEIGQKELKGEGDIKETEFDLVSLAAGIYHVRILDGQKVTNKKIAKIK